MTSTMETMRGGIMKSQIIVDSCCDLTAEMKCEMGISSVPLTMLLGDKEYCDDDSLNVSEFVSDMGKFAGKASSASPSPFLYQDAIEGIDNAYIVTLSSKLSGSYSNAVIGNNDSIENGNTSACLFDSKSASAGETLITIKLHELIQANLPKELIVKTLHRFIDNMKTYFVLENYDNLKKNGRLNKVAGSFVQLFNIKLIMGADGNGEIALFEKCRGAKKMVQQLISLIATSGKDIKNENLVISHCNNPSFAGELKRLIEERFNFKKIYIVPTGGLSSMYVDDKGIVFAF